MSKYRSSSLGPLAARFRALSNPNRLRIFLRLVACCGPGRSCSTDDEGTCVGDLGADLDLAPSTVSHHIKELHTAGLLAMKRSGQRVECWIPSEALESLAGFFRGCCEGEVDGLLSATAARSARRRG